MAVSDRDRAEFDPAVAAPDIALVEAVARRRLRLDLSPSTLELIAASHRSLLRSIGKGAEIYGVTTGLGAGVDTAIAVDEALQGRIPLARAVGVGRRADQAEVRAMMAARVFRLCAGHSGISAGAAQALVDMLNAGLHPLVPMTGSLGEADLAPLAHVALALTGEGSVEHQGRILAARDAFAECGLAPPVLTGRDGLALVSSNAASVGTGALVVHDAGQALRAGLAAAALAFEGYRANVSPLDPRAAAVRPAAGQGMVAATMMKLLAGGTLLRPDGARRLQDPLSFRSVASVTGTAFFALHTAREVVELELRTADDNPAVLAEDDTILANANFDTTHLALTMETLGQALARVAACSVERVMKLMSPASSELPRFLAAGGEGRNGYATLQKTAAALLAEIGHAANPMPIVTVPVADRVEDYATMALTSVRKTGGIVTWLRLLTAIEAIVSAQAIELRGLAEPGEGTGRLYRAVRAVVPHLDEDRPSTPDVEALERLIGEGGFDAIVAPLVEGAR